MAVVGASVLPVVEFDVDHGRAAKANLGLDDAVSGRQLQAMHGCVSGDRRLAFGSRNVHVAGLGSFEGAFFEVESGHDFVPERRVLGSLKIVGKEQPFSYGERLIWN